MLKEIREVNNLLDIAIDKRDSITPLDIEIVNALLDSLITRSDLKGGEKIA